MANLIRGVPVTLYEKKPAGTDEMHAPVFHETPVVVENVLITPLSSQEVTDTLNLYGKRAEYTLYIPKGDAHHWEDSRVSFFGQDFYTVGFAQQYIESNVPGPWNKTIKAARYG